MDNLSNGQLLEKELTYKVKHIAAVDKKFTDEAYEFAKEYMNFLTNSKTERLATENILQIAKKNGYNEYDASKIYSEGDKVYINNRGKSVILSTIGKNPVVNGVSIVASHIDSPRLDLKPNPIYENTEIAYFKTHYYGGIKKYQWGTIPLAIHGVLYKTNGEKVDIHIGEEDSDPVFCLTDILPHLSKDQRERKMDSVIKGEEMNVVIASMPFQDEKVKEAVKLTALSLLNEKYGIKEREFINAEIEIVPAGKARDVGLDRSMIGSYGHDDRVCAYTSLMAEVNCKKPEYTTVSVFADKEEVGSDGTTGLNSDFLAHFVMSLAKMQGCDYYVAFQHSKCLSADVNAAYDPTFSDVMEPNNSSYINHGTVITKYTGAGGKSSTNDSSAEYVAYITNLFDNKGVYWQTGELGKVDQGGGGTVAKYISKLNIDTVDIGVPVLSMHAPFELVAKTDVYATFKAFEAFLNRQ